MTVGGTSLILIEFKVKLRFEFDIKDTTWREDSGLLTDKFFLPVSQLRFGGTGGTHEEDYHTLEKLKCYGMS